MASYPSLATWAAVNTFSMENKSVLSSPETWIWHHWGQSKDDPTGFNVALPNARPHWNKLSTKADPVNGLWHPDVALWGEADKNRVSAEVVRKPL